MKTLVRKLSVQNKPIFVASPRVTPVSKLSFHRANRTNAFSTTQEENPISTKAFDLLPKFNAFPPETGYNPRNMLFISDVVAKKQLLFSLFNKVGRLSPTDSVPVYRVKTFADQKMALIHFKDARSVDHVLQQDLVIDGKKLQMARHRMVEFWNMMEPSKTKLLFSFHEEPGATLEELQHFFVERIDTLGKEFLIQPFVKFHFHKRRGVMEFPTEQDAEKALKILKFTNYNGQVIDFSHVKTKDINQAHHQQLILVKEDELQAALRNDDIGNHHARATTLMKELIKLGYHFKSASAWLASRMLRHARYTRDYDLLKILCEQITEGLSEGTPQEHLLSDLIVGWGFLRNSQRVDECVQHLKKHFTELRLSTYSSLMEAYRYIRNGEKILQIYEYLKQQGTMTPAIIAAVLKHYEQQGDVARIFNIIEEAQASNQGLISSWHYVILLVAVRKAQQFEKIPLVIQHLRRNNIQMDFNINTAVLHGYAMAGDIASSLKCFEEMKIQGWIPQISHYFSVIVAYKKAKFFDGQMKWFRKLLDDGLLPNPGIMVAILSSAMAEGRDPEIKEILETVKMSPRLQQSGSIINLVRKYHYFKKTGQPWVEPVDAIENKEEAKENEKDHHEEEEEEVDLSTK